MSYPRLNIYLDSEHLKERIKVAAARAGVSLSEYALEALRRRLAEEGLMPPSKEARRKAARAMDRIRKRIGPIGISVKELVEEGRRR
ncbi:MAG: hypothetical protein ACRDH6_05845 [Actinomycetota bacterium]